MKDDSNEQPKLGLDPETWSFRFKFEGHIYTLIKRNPSKDGAYSIRTIIDGKNVTKTLKTNVAAAASEVAIRKYIKPAKAGNWDVVNPPPPPPPEAAKEYARLAAVIACYREISLGRTRAGSVRNNISALRLVVRRGLGNDTMKPEEVDLLPSTVLTGKLVGDFEDYMNQLAVREKRDLESNKRTVAGYLRQARSLFKKTAFPRYAEKDVHLPDIKGTRDEPGFLKRAVEKAARIERVAPAEDLVRKTEEASLKLRKKDRVAYIAFIMGATSLRRGEASFMKWDWIVTQNGRPYVSVPAQVTKSGVPRCLPLDKDVARELEAYRPLCTAKDGFVFPSKRPVREGQRLRAADVFKRVNAFMRATGWKTNHTMHELRAMAISAVRDMFGIDSAQTFAGHQDPRTTIDGYAGKKAIDKVVFTLPLKIGKPIFIAKKNGKKLGARKKAA